MACEKFKKGTVAYKACVSKEQRDMPKPKHQKYKPDRYYPTRDIVKGREKKRKFPKGSSAPAFDLSDD